MRGQTSVEYIILLAVGIVITLFVVVLLFDNSETKSYTTLEDLQNIGGTVSVVGYDVTDYATTLDIKNIERSTITITSLRINGQECVGINPTYIDAGDSQEVVCENVFGTANQDVRYPVIINWTVVQTGGAYSSANEDIVLSDATGSKYLGVLDNTATYSFSNKGCWDISGSQPWPICTCYDLNLTRQSFTTRSANYSLQNNIDFERCMDVFGDAGWTSGSGWEPIGECTGSCGPGDDPFNGTLDGNDFIISNLFISRPTTNYVGLFGYAEENAKFYDLTLGNIDVLGQSFVGGLAGRINSGLAAEPNAVLQNITVTGKVNGSSASGGMFGYVSRSDAIRLSFTGSVYSPSQVGGLIGDAFDVNLYYSWVSGYVNGSTAAGGIWAQGYDSQIDNSNFVGKVSGEISVGGLSGQGTTYINRSYFSGEVVGRSEVGGIQGYGNYLAIENSYVRGTVNGTTNVGGMIGYSYGGSITNSYAEAPLECATICGGLVGSSSSDGFSGATWTNYTGDNAFGCVGFGPGDNGTSQSGCTP